MFIFVKAQIPEVGSFGRGEGGKAPFLISLRLKNRMDSQEYLTGFTLS